MNGRAEGAAEALTGKPCLDVLVGIFHPGLGGEP